jgi:hypothetical protein
MRKIIILLSFLFLISIAEAVNISLTISWTLSSSVVRPGGDMIIYLTASNPGLDLNSVVITATPGPSLQLTSGNKIELGDMPATTSQQSSISVRVDDNAKSSVSYVYLEAKYYYSTTEYKRTFYIPITIKKDPLLEINNVKFNDTAEPGKTILFSFDIYNRGDVTIRDLNIKLNKTDLFTTLGSTGESIIKELGISEFKNLEFLITINPETSIGIESIPVTLSYFDDIKANNFTEVKNIGLKVSGKADFIITISSNGLYYGRVGKVTVSIANRGTASAEYVSVNAESEFGSKEFYIGSLDSDDSETIDIPQDLSRASGKYPIYLTLNYRDKFDNNYSFEKIIEAMPANAPPDYNIVIIIVIVLIVVYWLYRRRKKK